MVGDQEVGVGGQGVGDDVGGGVDGEPHARHRLRRVARHQAYPVPLLRRGRVGTILQKRKDL